MSVEPSSHATGVDPSPHATDSGATVSDPGEPPVAMVGSFVSLRTVVAALRRRRRVWILTAVAGLAVGLAVPFARPPKYTATVVVLLAPDGTTDPTQAMATDEALLVTTGVAQLALDRLRLHESASTFVSQYTGTSAGSQVLDITVTAPTTADAVRRADALAPAFLQFLAQQLKRSNQAVVGALNAQLAALSSEVSQLDSTINGLPPAQVAAAQASGTGPVASLLAQRTQDVGQETTIQQTIQTDDVDATAAEAGNSVLAVAEPDHHSRLKPIAADAGAGLLAGLIAGVALIAVLAVASDRLRRREDVAQTVGAPVEVSVGRFRTPRWRRVGRLRRRVEHPGRAVSMVAQHLRMDLVGAPGEQHKLAVVSVDSPEPAAVVVAGAARALAAEGMSVVVADLTPDRLLARLLRVRGTGVHTTNPGEQGLPIQVCVPPEGGLPTADRSAPAGSLVPPTAQVTLVLAALDPAVGADHLAGWARRAVLVVTAGRSNAEKLRANAEMVSSAGLSLDHVILFGADRDDCSLGRTSSPSQWATDRPLQLGPGGPVSALHSS